MSTQKTKYKITFYNVDGDHITLITDENPHSYIRWELTQEMFLFDNKSRDSGQVWPIHAISRVAWIEIDPDYEKPLEENDKTE